MALLSVMCLVEPESSAQMSVGKGSCSGRVGGGFRTNSAADEDLQFLGAVFVPRELLWVLPPTILLRMLSLLAVFAFPWAILPFFLILLPILIILCLPFIVLPGVVGGFGCLRRNGTAFTVGIAGMTLDLCSFNLVANLSGQFVSSEGFVSHQIRHNGSVFFLGRGVLSR
jgi:hypothetical protein